MTQFAPAAAPLTPVGEGVSRRVLVNDRHMMMVEVHFEKNAVGSVHTHPHSQCTYVLSGAFTFTVGGRPYPVKKGDSLLFEPDQPHGCVCEEKGVLLDVFTPAREDFLT